jgi:DNA-binding CsgD family transcriptional regulator
MLLSRALIFGRPPDDPRAVPPVECGRTGTEAPLTPVTASCRVHRAYAIPPPFNVKWLSGAENQVKLGTQKPRTPIEDDGKRGSRFRFGTLELILLSVPIEDAPLPQAPRPLLAAALTAAEATVVELALAGHRNAAIAQRRRTLVSTVKKQLELAYRKLGVGSRAELVALYARAPSGGRQIQGKR